MTYHSIHAAILSDCGTTTCMVRREEYLYDGDHENQIAVGREIRFYGHYVLVEIKPIEIKPIPRDSFFSIEQLRAL